MNRSSNVNTSTSRLIGAVCAGNVLSSLILFSLLRAEQSQNSDNRVLVDYDNPVLIDMIGEEIDVTSILASLEGKPKALATLAKAEKLGWQINGSNEQGVTILLKGKKTGLISYNGEFSAA